MQAVGACASTRMFAAMLASIALLPVGCHRQTEAPPAVNAGATTAKTSEGCRIGTVLGPDGNVAQTKSVFVANEPIYITLRSSSATADSQVTVQILDARGEELKSLFGSLGKENTVTFPMRNLSPGRYTARSDVGGKKLCEPSFEIR